MNQKTSQPAAEPAEHPVSAPLDPGHELSLPAARLAGSEDCLNCGTVLQGPYCHYCGQPDRRFLRFFPALLRELLQDSLDLDSRAFRTLKPLLFKPGRLTRDYLEGRRFRYTPPLRLYLLTSICFFLLAATLSSNALQVDIKKSGSDGSPSFNIFLDDPTGPETIDAEELKRKLEEAGVADSEKAVRTLEQIRDRAAGKEVPEDPFTADQIQVNGKPWNRETNPVVIDFMPAFVNDRINDEIEKSPAKAKRINENPNLIVDRIFDLLPGTMFVLLPVVALLFKFWYAFARRYYIEHLIYALHNHSFIFLWLMLILLLELAGDWGAAHSWPVLRQAANWLVDAVSMWIPVYLLLSLKHVYGQGWALTVGKFGVIGISYVTLLALVTSIVAVLGFVLL